MPARSFVRQTSAAGDESSPRCGFLPSLLRLHLLTRRPPCFHGWPEVRALREFGDLEMAIMEVMWAGDGPHVVREVRERLRYARPVAYTTVMTSISI